MKFANAFLAIFLVAGFAPINAQNGTTNPGASVSTGAGCDANCVLQRKLDHTNRKLNDLKKGQAASDQRTKKLEDGAATDQKAIGSIVARQSADEKETGKIGSKVAEVERSQHIMSLSIFLACGALGFLLILVTVTRNRRRERPAAIPGVPTPKDLYGCLPSPTPSQVRECLSYHKLKEGIFTIDLPEANNGLGAGFEYRACVVNGNVVAYFEGNDRVVALTNLRKIAARLYDESDGPLKPIELKKPRIRLIG